MAVRETAGEGINWSWRAHVALAAILLPFARFLVRRVRLSRWRNTLGTVASLEDTASPRPACPPRDGGLLASAVERADALLPATFKCLPRAVVLQWLMRLSGLHSALVIAFHATDRDGDDGYHAWVEQDGHVLIGHCDTARYRRIMVLALEPRPESPAAERA